jgi:hypothetical protein
MEVAVQFRKGSLVCLGVWFGLAVGACRSGEVTPDLSSPDDQSVPGDSSVPPDLTGIDLRKIDMANADLYTPLFKTAVPYTVESGPIFLATADLNKDTKRDLVVANTNNPGGGMPATVSVLLGNGDGTFQTKVSTNIDPTPRALAITDLNGDTYPDVIVAIADGFDVLLGSAGGLGAPTKTTIASPYIGSLSMGDIDGDGKVDAVLADLGVVTGKAWVSLGNGSGGFGTPMSFEVTSTATVFSTIVARIGDMNNDGKIDIITANSEYPTPTTNTVSILTNTSTPGNLSMGATPTELMAGAVPIDMLVGQLDGQNQLDIVVANLAGNDINVFLSSSNAGALTFATPATYMVPGGPTALTFGDIDADSKPDILTANAQASTVTVLYGGAGGMFGQATANRPGTESYGVGTNPTSLVAATFNGDIKIDVATANEGAGTVSVLLNQR